jgi:hypothetical protein
MGTDCVLRVHRATCRGTNTFAECQIPPYLIAIEAFLLRVGSFSLGMNAPIIVRLTRPCGESLGFQLWQNRRSAATYQD